MQGIYIVVATLIILTENLTENLYLKLDTIENYKKWTLMPILVSMSIFYITVRLEYNNFAPEKLETGTALRATSPIFRARSATLFCTRNHTSKIINDII